MHLLIITNMLTNLRGNQIISTSYYTLKIAPTLNNALVYFGSGSLPLQRNLHSIQILLAISFIIIVGVLAYLVCKLIAFSLAGHSL